MNTALVVIDVQDSFRLQPSWADISLPDIVTRTQHLIEAARVRGELVAWVLHHSPGTGSPFRPRRRAVRPAARPRSIRG